MQRIEFIKTCCLASVSGTTLAAVLESCLSANYFAQTTIINNQIIVKKTEFVKTEKDEFTERKYVLVKAERLNFPICIFKINEENYSALLLQCTHKGCELQPQGDYLACPCHGSEFSSKGEVTHPPAEQPLKTFQITTDHDHIYIQL